MNKEDAARVEEITEAVSSMGWVEDEFRCGIQVIKQSCLRKADRMMEDLLRILATESKERERLEGERYRNHGEDGDRRCWISIPLDDEDGEPDTWTGISLRGGACPTCRTVHARNEGTTP